MSNATGRADAAATEFPAWRELTPQQLDDVLDYLAGGGKALRQQYTELFGKIDLDENSFETRQGRVRRDLLENIGVIPMKAWSA